MNLPVRPRESGDPVLYGDNSLARSRQAGLPRSINSSFQARSPFLELPLAKDRSFSCFVDLEPDEGLNSICFGEPGN